MNKTIAIHQPNYIPWLGYFFKIYQSDTFVFLDDAQYSTSGMHNYHYIKTRKGPQRLKIPVHQSLGDRINHVRINNTQKWYEQHLNLINENYRNADHFEEVYADIESLIVVDHEFISELNISIIRFICDKLGIDTEFVCSSDLQIESVREERIIDICKSLRGNIYYSGTGARSYQDEDHFRKKGIQIRYSEFQVFEYVQQYIESQSNVTIIDFLMNCGYDWDHVKKHQTNV